MEQLCLLDLLTEVEPEPIASPSVKPAKHRPILIVWRQWGDVWHYTGQMGYADRLELRENDRAVPPGTNPNHLQILQIQNSELTLWQQAQKTFYLELAQRFRVHANRIARFYFWLTMQSDIRTMRCAALYVRLAQRLQLLKTEHDRTMEKFNGLQ